MSYICLHPDYNIITRIYACVLCSVNDEIETNLCDIVHSLYGVEIVRHRIKYIFCCCCFVVLKGQLIYYGKSERLFYAYHTYKYV